MVRQLKEPQPHNMKLRARFRADVSRSVRTGANRNDAVLLIYKHKRNPPYLQTQEKTKNNQMK